MSELANHVISNTIRGFRRDELNEVILTVYNIIKRTVRDEADELELTSTHFRWSKRGSNLGDFQIDDLKPSVSFRDALKLVIERDDIIQRHIQLVLETPEKVIYRFV